MINDKPTITTVSMYPYKETKNNYKYMFDEEKIPQGTEKRKAVRDLKKFMTEAKEVLHKNKGGLF